MRKLTGIILAALLWPCSAVADPAEADYPVVTAEVRPARATIGSRLEYVVNVSGERIDGIEIVPPAAGEFIPPPGEGPAPASPASAAVPLYIIHSAESKEESRSGKRSISLVIGIVYYRTGKHALPAVEVRGADGIEIGYRVPDVLIEPGNPTGEFQEIEPPLELGGNYYRLYALIALIGLLAAGGFFLFRRFEDRRTSVAVPAPPETPPLDEFLARMQTIRARVRAEEESAEEYVVEASRCFRVYLTRLFGIDAMEMTALELAASLGCHLGEEAYARVRYDFARVAGLWDLAKFAEFTPSAASLAENLELAMELGRKIAREARGAGH